MATDLRMSIGRCLGSVLLGAVALFPATPPAYEKLLHVRVPMRDGVYLDTHVFHAFGPDRFPTILLRTPYGKGLDLLPSYYPFIIHGFAVVVQDVRGRNASEGVFDPLSQEGPDGYDTLNWIARQSWSDGNVGMAGGSYLGIAQWKAALLDNPHLKAIFPVVSGYDDYLDRFYSRGGASKLGHRLLWFSENLLTPGMERPRFEQFIYHVPLRTADRAATGQTLHVYQRVLDHPLYDSFWRSLSVREHIDRIHIPVFIAGGWYDNYVESDLAAFAALSHGSRHEAAKHRILIGPWPHNMSIPFAGIDYGRDSTAPIRTLQLAWFNEWLKGSAPEPLAGGAVRNARFELSEAPVRLFVMGVNRWRDEMEWPLSRTRFRSFYLAGKGHANSASGDGSLEMKLPRKDRPDRYIYDPRRPVPTVGGAVCCNPKVFAWGPKDQRAVEAREDVLVYTSGVLKRDLEVTGAVKTILYVSTDAPDTDFTAKLVDVFPSGEARNLADGILRLRYRDGLDKSVMGRPGQIYAVVIDTGVTSNVFLKGHRIRLEVSSSNFPRFDRNPNTGRPVADETTSRKAAEEVHHGGLYGSYLLLPVIPELTGHDAARYGARGSNRKSSSFRAP